MIDDDGSVARVLKQRIHKIHKKTQHNIQAGCLLTSNTLVTIINSQRISNYHTWHIEIQNRVLIRIFKPDCRKEIFLIVHTRWLKMSSLLIKASNQGMTLKLQLELWRTITQWQIFRNWLIRVYTCTSKKLHILCKAQSLPSKSITINSVK